jgi:hypothetical protein
MHVDVFLIVIIAALLTVLLVDARQKRQDFLLEQSEMHQP